METASKRPAGGAEGDTAAASKRRRSEDVDDADVEAFFAILRRVRDASMCLGVARSDGNGSGNGRKRTVDGGLWRWKPAFEWEDFEEPPPSDAVKDDGLKPSSLRGREAGERTAGSLDLNAAPEPERGDDTASA